MKRITTLLVLLLATGPALAGSLPLGSWARGDGNARVIIAPCGEALCATNTYIKDTSGGEAVGDKLVMNLKPDGEGKLSGKAYDAKRDMNYAITIHYTGESMSTRGCIIGVLCKSTSWSKLK